nr:hypothetical protein [Tanacetum cinerariifolium]
DFNVTIKAEEHSSGGSVINEDIQEFIDCINEVEVEDIHNSDMFFTWIKSPSRQASSVIKKLDRIINMKKKSFRFPNFIAEKEDFLPIMKQGWNKEVECYHLFKVVKKLKMLKIQLRKLA